MSLRVPVGYAEAWMGFNLSTDPETMYCSLGLAHTVVGAPTIANTDGILTVMQTRLKAIVSDDYTLGPGHVVWGGSGGDIRIDGTITPAAGTRGTTPLPQNCSLLVRKVTAVGGRRGRGRMYVPGVNQADVVNNGQILSASKTAIQTQLDGLVTDLTALTTVDFLALLHGTSPYDPSPISSLELQSSIATQRRRLRK